MRISKGSGPILLAAAVASVCVPATASAQSTSDRKPRLGFSIADPKPGSVEGGPLFKMLQTVIEATNKDGEKGLKRFVASDALLELSWFNGSDLKSAPFGADQIRAATSSCLGPFSADEGSNWAQLSWVCRTDAQAPLARYLNFRNSPELSLTVWFEKGLIKEIDAIEPLQIPFARRVSMGAYELMKDREETTGQKEMK